MSAGKSWDLGCLAWCDGCGWTTEGRSSNNVVGNAAKHHNRTGHVVHVEATRHVQFGGLG